MIETKSHPTLQTPAKTMRDVSKYDANPSGIVVGLTLSMAWQLAIVVLLPVFGGHELDARLHSSPLWTLMGLVVAMTAMIVVVRRTLARLNDSMAKSADKEEKH